MAQQIIVYDGECRFCIWSTDRVKRLDRKGQFDYVPRQTPGVEERFPFLTQSDFNTGLRLIIGADTVFVGADAVYEIYRRMPPFHLVAWIYRLPLLHGLCRMVYGWIARNRHRLGRVECDTGACTIDLQPAGPDGRN